MKEQIGVECYCRCHVKKLHENICQVCKCLDPAYEVKLLREDNKRLKRLEGNVKNQIIKNKKFIDNIIENQVSGGKYSKSDDRNCIDLSQKEITYLENLYK